jgi:hypothetical protein
VSPALFIAPLVLAALICMAAFITTTFSRRLWRVALCGLVVPLGWLGWMLILAHGPAVNDVLSTPADQVRAIVVQPTGSAASLVKTPKRMESRAVIARIVDAIHGSVTFYPNHPQTRWEALLELELPGRSAFCVVRSTGSQLLVEVFSDRTAGWLLATRAADSDLGLALEQNVH